MLERTDFDKKQIIVFFPADGDKLSFKNDNIVIKNADGRIKIQATCYRLFLVFIVGDTTITTGLLSRAGKFGFSICLMNRNMKIYRFIGNRLEGNTALRRLQYLYDGDELAQHIILNKIINQKNCLKRIRTKNELLVDAIKNLERYINKLEESKVGRDTLLGIEGSASRVYFSQVFNNAVWKGRKPRIKPDYINTSLDIGYTILFNIMDALINVYGFDEYKGVLHTNFYMRKSLVCDLIEPFRPIIDYATRCGLGLKQICQEDFNVYNNKYTLDWNKSKSYTKLYLETLMNYKNDLFMYVQSYYRAFMKQKAANDFPVFEYGV